MLDLDVAERVLEFGVEDQHVAARVVDDVLDLVGAEAEVDRHGDPAPGAGAEEGREETGGVLRDDADARTLVETEFVEAGGHALGEVVELAVREIAEARGRLIRFVVDADSIAVHDPRPLEVITDRHRCLHTSPRK